MAFKSVKRFKQDAQMWQTLDSDMGHTPRYDKEEWACAARAILPKQAFMTCTTSEIVFF